MATIKCGILGSIAKEKGYLRAIRLIESNEDISLLIVGPLWNPLEKKTLEFILEKEKKLKNLKVEVRKLKEEEFEEYVKKLDILLLPYLNVVPASGIFSRLLRYMKPMITWETPFFKEIEKEYGACITVNSVAELEKKILEVSRSKRKRNDLVKGAKKLLDLCWFVGIVEKSDRDFDFLFKEMGLKKEKIKNINASKKILKLDDKLRKKIYKENPLDVELYRYALKLNKQKRPPLKKD